VTLERENQQIYARSAAFRMLIPQPFYQRLEGHLNKSVKLGLRPEDMHVPNMAPFEVTEDNTIQGILNEIEPTATGCAAYLTTVEAEIDYVATFRLRLPVSYLGREIPLGMNMEKVQLFDAVTEESLMYPYKP
jgi:multiple sugar transport system ATP-binding protein